MTGPAFSPCGARARGALALLGVLEDSGHHLWATGERLHIEPVTGLCGADRRVLEDLKPELLAWLAFSPHQRSLIAPHDPDLQQLKRYREGLEYWLRFTPEEQRRMIGLPWTLEDLANLCGLRESGGEVLECEGATNELSPQVAG